MIENEDDNNIKLIISILVSSILGGIMSLYISNLYQQNASILQNPNLKTFWTIGIPAIIYLFYIGIALFIAYIILKIFTLLIEILTKPINLLLEKFETNNNEDEESDKGLEFLKIYKSNEDFINFSLLLALGIWLVFYKLDILFTIFSMKQITIGILVFIFYEVFYLIRSFKK